MIGFASPKLVAFLKTYQEMIRLLSYTFHDNNPSISIQDHTITFQVQV